LRTNFVKAYTQLFGHEVAGLDVEVVSWALSLRTETQLPERVAPGMGDRAATRDQCPPMDRREVFDAKSGDFHDCAIYDRADLPRAVRLDGPLIVTEKETSTYVSPDYGLTLQEDDSLLIQRLRKEGV